MSFKVTADTLIWFTHIKTIIILHIHTWVSNYFKRLHFRVLKCAHNWRGLYRLNIKEIHLDWIHARYQLFRQSESSHKRQQQQRPTFVEEDVYGAGATMHSVLRQNTRLRFQMQWRRQAAGLYCHQVTAHTCQSQVKVHKHFVMIQCNRSSCVLYKKSSYQGKNAVCAFMQYMYLEVRDVHQRPVTYRWSPAERRRYPWN